MIHFYEKRKLFFVCSLLIFLVGIVFIFINGIQLDIEFKGGSILKYQFTGDIDVEAAADTAEETLGRSANCQISTSTDTDVKSLVINLAGNEGLSSQEQENLDAALKAQFSDNQLELSETSIVEPFIGKQFLRNGIFAIILSFMLIILYVWYSFRKIGGLSAGIMSLAALLHDCLIVFFVFVIFKIPFDENYIAATLTIIGFSVNDTIVIFDRIRENMADNRKEKLPIDQLVNKSISQSLTRSINTNAAVFISVLIVCIFSWLNGISSILAFALPMTFGVISGCYSTICIAGPLWVMWKKRKEVKTA